MKVLVVNNLAPFVWGGAEELAFHLAKHLRLSGHLADVVRIPFAWEPAERIPSQMLLARSVDVSRADAVIALKFPAYLVEHKRKVLWLLHQYRQAYDLYDAGMSNIPSNAFGTSLRQLIAAADSASIGSARKVFTNSPTTGARLKKYNGLNSQVLLPPLNDPELFQGGPCSGYIFAGGRVNSLKRQSLLIEAARFAPRNTRLVVAGPPETSADAHQLETLVRDLGLESRVTLDLRFLSRSEVAAYVNNSSACAYIPFDEDSLGYVAMEAAQAAKPIITTTDSGGVRGLVVHGETGWVAEASPQSLGDCFSAALANPALSARLGTAARSHWDRLGVSWPNVIRTLLE